MNKTYAIAIAVLAILVLLTVAILRGQASRELILKRNGLPWANLRGEVLAHGAGATVVATSTDANGRLDLSAVPAGTEMIAVRLLDATGPVYNGDLGLPRSGSRTIDFRGNRTICTTKRIYVDFGPFQVTGQETRDDTQSSGPSRAETEQPPLPKPAAEAVENGESSPPAR